MQKEEFKKEVIALFSTSKYHELDTFLQENRAHTVENKTFIKNLNKHHGQPFITATITTLEKAQKEEYKQLIKSIESAVKDNDSTALFNALKPISYDEQISDNEIVYHIYPNTRLHSLFFKNIIDNQSQLNEENKQRLGRICLGNILAPIDGIDNWENYYFNNTNNVEDKIFFMKRKCQMDVHTERKSDQEKEEIVNQLFDLMATNKHDPSTHFSENAEQYVYLNDTNSKLIEDKTGALEAEKLVSYLIGWNPNALNHYLKKQDKDFILEVPLELYLNLINKVDTSKFLISSGASFTNELLAEKITYDQRFFFKMISDEKLQAFLKSQKSTFTIPEKNSLINRVLYELTKDEVNTLFNKFKIFNFNEKQQSIIEDYLTNHDINIIKTINREKDMPGNIGYRALQEYVLPHINDADFIQKLNATGKKHILNSYFDYSTIQDSTKFINDFLKDLPKEEYSCFHMGLFHRLEKNKNQKEILQYLFNEKTIFNPHSTYHALEVFNFLNEDKKKEIIGGIVKETAQRNHFETYYKHMKNDKTLEPQQMDNLEELRTLYDTLLPAKGITASQHQKYKAKKRR